MTFSIRLATPDDSAALAVLMELSIEQLQRDFLSPAQVAASRAVMGLDQQLIADRTYFLVQHGDRLAGGGGWSRRATLYGGDQADQMGESREVAPLDSIGYRRLMPTGNGGRFPTLAFKQALGRAAPWENGAPRSP